MTNSCTSIGILSEILILIGFIQTARTLHAACLSPRYPLILHIPVFAALRVFAIWNKSYVWSLPVFALSMAPFVTNLVRVAFSRTSRVFWLTLRRRLARQCQNTSSSWNRSSVWYARRIIHSLCKQLTCGYTHLVSVSQF